MVNESSYSHQAFRLSKSESVWEVESGYFLLGGFTVIWVPLTGCQSRAWLEAFLQHVRCLTEM